MCLYIIMFTVAFSHGKITSDFYFPLLLLYIVSIFFYNEHIYFVFIFKKINVFPFGKNESKKKNLVLKKTPIQIS